MNNKFRFPLPSNITVDLDDISVLGYIGTNPEDPGQGKVEVRFKQNPTELVEIFFACPAENIDVVREAILNQFINGSSKEAPKEPDYKIDSNSQLKI